MRVERAWYMAPLGTVVLAIAVAASAASGTSQTSPEPNAAPRLVAVNGPTVVMQWKNEAPRSLQEGQSYRSWELVGVLHAASPIAVLEHRAADTGAFVYVGKKGIVANLSEAAGNSSASHVQRVFPASYAQRILASKEDVLGDEVLAKGGDPTYAAVSKLLPPLVAYTFLGTTQSPEKVLVWPDGRLGLGIRKRDLNKVLFDPAKLLGVAPDDRDEKIEGLIGGYLPVIDYRFFDRASKRGFEEIAFATGGENPTIYVRLRDGNGKPEYWKLPGAQRLKDGAEFYRGLLDTAQYWEHFFQDGMQIKLPDARVQNASKAAIVRALIGEVGLHPKYGVGFYAEERHDTFPPTTIELVSCLLDWGYTKQAGDRLGYYLSNYVKQDGTFDYYGPALSEYGQMLALAVRYVRVTHDAVWQRQHTPQLQRIAQYITAQLHASREKYPVGSPYRGLLWGAAEADTASDRQLYFSGNVWCWRGLHDLSGMLMTEAQRTGDAASGENAKQVAAEASELRTDVLAALERSFQHTTPPFLPPVAGKMKPFGNMTESEFASYTNYRYWPEMLSAGLLPPAMDEAILSYRRTHGGDVAATTRFDDHLDDWTYANHAWGLLQADDISHFLLGFYGHMAYSQTPGTFTAYEQAAIKGERSRTYVADYCVPSQVVTPQMLRWMLVWEPWDRNEVWIGAAVPKQWFRDGFSARAVPTAWGPVSVVEGQRDGTITMNVTVANPHPSLSVYVLIRVASSRSRPKVSMKDEEGKTSGKWQWDAARKAVKLTGTWSQATIQISQ